MNKLKISVIILTMLLIVWFSQGETAILENKIGVKAEVNSFGSLFETNENLENILKNLSAKIVKTEIVNGTEILYGITPYSKTFIFENGKRYNLQIAKRENSIKIGFPLIYVGY